MVDALSERQVDKSKLLCLNLPLKLILSSGFFDSQVSSPILKKVYFDAAVVFVTKFSLLFRFALVILWQNSSNMATAGLCYSSVCYTYILGIHTKGKSFASVSLDPFLECRTNFWAFGSGQQQTLGRFFLWVWLTHLLDSDCESSWHKNHYCVFFWQGNCWKHLACKIKIKK